MHKIIILDDNKELANKISKLKMFAAYSDTSVRVMNRYELIDNMSDMDDVMAIITTQTTVPYEVLEACHMCNVISIIFDTSLDNIRMHYIKGVFDCVEYPVKESKLEAVFLRIFEAESELDSSDKIESYSGEIARCILSGENVDAATATFSQYLRTDDIFRAQAFVIKAKRRVFELIKSKKKWISEFVYYKDSSLSDREYNIDKLIESFETFINEINGLIKKYSVIDNPLISRIGNYILSNITLKITLLTAAENVYLNPSYISHIFRKEAGINFNDFVTEAKIDMAKRLLREENVRVYEVSSMVGYSNPEYFSKNFKKKVGCSPQEFQKLVHL